MNDTWGDWCGASDAWVGSPFIAPVPASVAVAHVAPPRAGERHAGAAWVVGGLVVFGALWWLASQGR